MYKIITFVLIGFLSLMPTANAEELYRIDEGIPDLAMDIVHIKRDGSRIGIAIYSASDKESAVLESDCFEAHPSWSPDHKKIVFTADCTTGGKKFMEAAEIYSANRDGSEKTRLTFSGQNFVPSWSNNAEKIVFQSNRIASEQIYVMNPDGSNQVNISNNARSEMQPDWSPVDNKIVFSSGESFETRGIYIMDSNGKNRKQLTDLSFRADNPRWSPDGKQIVFILNKDNRGYLYIMNSDGSELKDITPSGYSIHTASWSPDGQKIAITKINAEFGVNVGVIDYKNHVLYELTNYFSSSPNWK